MLSKQHYRPWTFFSIVLVSTFVLWSIGGYQSFQEKPDESYMLWMLLGLMTPFLVSLWLLGISGNSLLRKDFITKLIDLRLISLKMIPFMFLVMPISVVISIYISTMFGESTQQYAFSESFSFSIGFVPVILLLLFAAIFEELGWRGYGFESLLSRYNFFKSSIIFGLLWSLWHLPLLWVNGSYQYEIYTQNPLFALNFFVGTVILGIIVSWVCYKNQKSILAAIVFHFAINLSQEALQMTQVSKSIQTFLLLLIAVAIIYKERELFFAPVLKDAADE